MVYEILKMVSLAKQRITPLPAATTEQGICWVWFEKDREA